MYKMMKLVDTVRIPPTLLGEEVMPTVKNALREKLEGQVDKKLGSLVAICKIDEIGEGHILVGDGAVYYDVTFEAIMFVPELQEIIEGEVVEAVGFGVFVGMGPMDGLLHVSQITDDFISYDAKNARLVTKTGGKVHCRRGPCKSQGCCCKYQRKGTQRKQNRPYHASDCSWKAAVARRSPQKEAASRSL